ncbi:MAG: sel1 repeat family protein [Campylobacter sp.]|nr:sel1 repeat family protein [Campylobacter sp.]
MKKIIIFLMIFSSGIFAIDLLNDQKACENGDLKACATLGLLYYSNDNEKALKYLQIACDGDIYESCGILGTMYNVAKGVKQDYDKAFKYINKACMGGDQGACLDLGDMYASGNGVKQDYVKAKDIFERICEKKVDDFYKNTACTRLATFYNEGLGVKMDKQKAIVINRKTCDRGGLSSIRACFKYAVYNYDLGEKQKAVEYFKKACEIDNIDKMHDHTLIKIRQIACDNYNVLK